MFLRRKSKTVRGVGYSYWHLCRTVRTERGPRQQVVASLGKLDGCELAGLRGGWDDLPALLRGETPAPRPRPAPLPGQPGRLRRRHSSSGNLSPVDFENQKN